MKQKDKVVDLSAAGFSGFVIVLLQQFDFGGRDIAIICTPITITLLFLMVGYGVQKIGIKTTSEVAIERYLGDKLKSLDAAENDTNLSPESKAKFKKQREDIYQAQLNMYDSKIKKHNGENN